MALFPCSFFLAVQPRAPSGAPAASPHRGFFLLPFSLPSFGVADAPPLGHKDFFPAPERPVGWRGDGTGAFPGATPVTSWAEGEAALETMKVGAKGRAKEIKLWVFKNNQSKNIVWKTEMPAWSNSSPIVVGDKVFCMAEPHTLVCVDANSGKILWQHDNNPCELAGMPRERAAPLQTMLDLARVSQVIWRTVAGTGGSGGGQDHNAGARRSRWLGRSPFPIPYPLSPAVQRFPQCRTSRRSMDCRDRSV